MAIFNFLSGSIYIQRNTTNILMSVCTTILYNQYMESLNNDARDFPGDMPMRNKIYGELYHYMVHATNKGRHRSKRQY